VEPKANKKEERIETSVCPAYCCRSYQELEGGWRRDQCTHRQERKQRASGDPKTEGMGRVPNLG